MRIVVTGAFGFIGSNLINKLNQLGYNDIIAVDNLTDGSKVVNLANAQILDYIDKHDFIEEVLKGAFDNDIDYIFHQGACSSTIEKDGYYMMKNNYEYSSILLEFAQKNEIPFLYASSASVYGDKTQFIEDIIYENPLNVYAYSKFLFDQLVRRYLASNLTAPIVGLRYFNVYGPNEHHKNRMASIVLHHFNQYKTDGFVKLYKGCNGVADGEQSRDFIYINDVIKVNLFFFNNYIADVKEISGIFNCGTSISRTYNSIALATINSFKQARGENIISLNDAVNNGLIKYIPFPDDLEKQYQCKTEANSTKLTEVGFNENFTNLEKGVSEYINFLLKKHL